MPEWTKAYKSANKDLVNLASVLNEKSGGDKYTPGMIDINPSLVEHILEGYFGGVANTIDRMTKMGETFMGQREYDPRSFLILNRILKNGDERTEYRAVNNEYFRLQKEHDELKTRLRNYENDTDNGVFDYGDKINWLNNSPEYRRMMIYEDYSKDIKAVNDELKKASEDEAKDLEKELNGLKSGLVYASSITRMKPEELREERKRWETELRKTKDETARYEMEYYLSIIAGELQANGLK